MISPDPDRFFQTEIFERAGGVHTVIATARLLAVVIICGLGVGAIIVLIGRALGLLIKRLSGV